MKKILFFAFMFSVISGITAQNPAKYWVEFSDKDGSPYSISRPEEFLSPRAIEKRERLRIAITEQDIPVNEHYIKQLLAIDPTVVLLTQSKWLNGVTIYSEQKDIADKILALPFVTGIECTIELKSPEKFDYPRSSYLPPCNTEEILKIEADTDLDYGYSYAQTRLNKANWIHRMGAHGEGMFIMVIDGGFENADEIPHFEALRKEGRLVGTRNFVQPGRSVFVDGTHGTMTLSCMAGYFPDEMLGSAPKATYFLAQTEDGRSENKIEEDNWVAAAELADSLGCDLINSSLGYHKFDNPNQSYKYKDMDGVTSRASIAADIAASKGILVCVSAGNEGNDEWHYITSPADAKDILTVGGVDWYGNPANFSSYGPTYDKRVKPDAAAVGVKAVVAQADGTTGLSYGTSFASPILCGMAACLWQLFPKETPYAVMNAIRMAGNSYTEPDIQLGYGIPNFIFAHNLLSQAETGDDIFLVPERVVCKSGKLRMYYLADRPTTSFQIEVCWLGEEKGTLHHFTTFNTTGYVKITIPKLRSGKKQDIAVLKVSDNATHTTYSCILGVTKK